jgi:hypothetical protein
MAPETVTGKAVKLGLLDAAHLARHGLGERSLKKSEPGGETLAALLGMGGIIPSLAATTTP